MGRATYGRLPLNSQGVPSKLPLEYTAGGATLSWGDVEGVFDVSIGWVDNPQYLSLQEWLAKQPSGVPGETVSVDGMSGIVYVDPYSGVRAYLMRKINGLPHIYEIAFDCYGGQQECTPPPFWRQMLDSFKTLPSNN